MGQKLFGVATIVAAVAMLVVGGSIEASLIGKCDFKTRSVGATQLLHWRSVQPNCSTGASVIVESPGNHQNLDNYNDGLEHC